MIEWVFNVLQNVAVSLGISQPGPGSGQTRAPAADVGGTTATDAHCRCGGAEPPPSQTPTWAAVVALVGPLSLRRRPLPRRRGRIAAADDDEAKVL
jgi:hypothetical protein